MFDIDLSPINSFIGSIFGEIGKITNIILDVFEKFIYYFVLFFNNSFESFMLIEICILSYCILRSKQIGTEYRGQGGFNKIVFMFENYIKIHYISVIYFYMLIDSLYKIIFKTITLIIDGIRLFKPFG